MSTPQSTLHLTPRFRIGLRTVLSALGVLVAIAVTITILALTGANHTTVATPVTASQAAGNPTHATAPSAAAVEAATDPQSGGTTRAAGAANAAAHYACLGAAQRCLR